MRILFLGSPDFAVPSLTSLHESKDIEITAVITQPDRRKGRGQKFKPTPVKKAARDLGLKVMEAENVNKDSFLEKLEDLDFEAIVVVAFGQKLSTKILNLSEKGCINLHASLLPRYRGSSPIHQAIINGDKITGVTTIYMDEGWDTGDIIYKKEVEIARSDTVGILHDKLAEVGAKLLLETLKAINDGKAPRVKQDEKEASYAFKLEKEDGFIDWELTAEIIYNQVRGLNPWPGAYTFIDDKMLKIWETEIKQKVGRDYQPGTVVNASPDQDLVVQCGRGLLRIKKLQMEGRKRMSADKFLRGNPVEIGKVLGRR